MTRKKGPFTAKVSLNLAPWMEDGVDEVGIQLDEEADDGWWRKPRSSSDVIRLAIFKLLESRGITDPAMNKHAEVGKLGKAATLRS